MTQQTTVLICTAISLVTTGIGYMWGWFRSEGKWRYQQDNYRAIILDYGQQIRDGKQKHEALVRTYNTLADNYWKLEKDIECTVHETHEEVEKPFVDARWLSGELVPPEEERTFLDSVYGKEPDRRVPGNTC